MTLKEANFELEKLDNEYNYWLNEKEQLKSMVLPQATDIRLERVYGGKREDRLLKYTSILDDKKIDETLNYISKRRQNLINWIKEELNIMLKYGEVEHVIIQLKENEVIKDSSTGKYRKLTWEEIARKVHWSKSFCRNVYRNYKKKRDID